MFKMFTKMNTIICVYRVVKESVAAGDWPKVKKMIESLIQDFAYSSQSNFRNGGLIGLAAIAIALGVFYIIQINSFLMILL